jgi:hypothetical protein
MRVVLVDSAARKNEPADNGGGESQVGDEIKALGL